MSVVIFFGSAEGTTGINERCVVPKNLSDAKDFEMRKVFKLFTDCAREA